MKQQFIGQLFGFFLQQLISVMIDELADALRHNKKTAWDKSLGWEYLWICVILL